MSTPSRITLSKTHHAIGAAGYAFLFSGFGVISVALVSAEWLLAVFGALFVGAGGLILLSRGKVVIDAKKRYVIDQHGLWSGFKSDYHRLDAIDKIEIGKYVQGDYGNRRTVFAVWMHCSTGLVATGEFFDYLRARRHAEFIARIVGKDLHDSTTSKNKKRRLSEIDLPLQMRLRKAKHLMRMPRPLVSPRIIHFQTDKVGIITVLPPPFQIRAGLTLVGTALIAWFVCVFIFPLIHTLSSWLSVIISVSFALFSVLPETSIHEDLILQSDVITRRKRLGRFGLSKTVSIGSIEEMVANTGGSITLRGDDLQLTFGTRLSHEERRWVLEFLRYWLAQKTDFIA